MTMTRAGSTDTFYRSTDTFYRSTDARTWIPVSGSPQSESLPNLGVTEGAIWLVGDTIVRLPR
ncbi:MAG: hypothetical protein ACYCV4_01180 [Dermatophilaceae bacterium]